jgi:hypothetical protein
LQLFLTSNYIGRYFSNLDLYINDSIISYLCLVLFNARSILVQLVYGVYNSLMLDYVKQRQPNSINFFSITLIIFFIVTSPIMLYDIDIRHGHLPIKKEPIRKVSFTCQTYNFYGLVWIFWKSMVYFELIHTSNI